MSRTRWEKLKILLDDALKLKGAERNSFLATLHARDEGLHRELTSLLDAHSPSFLEEPPFLSSDDVVARPDSLIGGSIGRYRIREHLSSGGLGDVFRAVDETTGEVVAIKRLSPDALVDPKNRLRFEQEARVAMSLRHPNITTVHEIVSHEDERFLVMEYVAGRTLRAVLAERRLETERAVDYAIHITNALREAHTLGILHRDVKPGNVMITPEGMVKVLDFGLAKLVEPENVHGAPTEDERSLTREGLVMGSASYMSPEHLTGDVVDARSDVFSLGAVLYEMLSGRRAFEGATVLDIASSVFRDHPVLPSAVPSGLRDIVRKALEKRPEDRFPSMAVLQRALIDWRQRGDPATPHPFWRRLGSWFSGRSNEA